MNKNNRGGYANPGVKELIDRWTTLAAEARKRGAAPDSGGYPPGYWYGVSYGLEMAVQEAEQLLGEASA